MPPDNKIHFRCPKCDSKVSIPQEYAGKRGKCPWCAEKVLVPGIHVELNFDALIERSMEELHAKTMGHDGIWQLSNSDWDLDQDAGTIVFMSPKGIIATCPVQIIGTFSSVDKTWLWSWDNPSIDPALRHHAILCREYGEKHGIRALTSRKLTSANEDDGWQLTALACKLAGAQGGYRGPMGKSDIYVTIGVPSLSRNR
ncbi:MAG TPA: hypothetical protein PLN21_18510 [Gemmatales bacterium]|nr:hypothetical protein [Gemmatales bacterium]